MWNLPRPGIKPVSPALADEFLSILPLGKPPTTNVSEADNTGILTDPKRSLLTVSVFPPVSGYIPPKAQCLLVFLKKLPSQAPGPQFALLGHPLARSLCVSIYNPRQLPMCVLKHLTHSTQKILAE